MGFLVSISEGTRELETRHQSGKDQYDLNPFLYLPHIPITFCFSVEIGVQHLTIYKRSGCLFKGQQESRQARETLSQSPSE